MKSYLYVTIYFTRRFFIYLQVVLRLSFLTSARMILVLYVPMRNSDVDVPGSNLFIYYTSRVRQYSFTLPRQISLMFCEVDPWTTLIPLWCSSALEMLLSKCSLACSLLSRTYPFSLIWFFEESLQVPCDSKPITIAPFGTLDVLCFVEINLSLQHTLTFEIVVDLCL